MRTPTLCLSLSCLLLGACGGGETAAVAELQAQQARKAIEQQQAIEQQLDAVNAQSQQRLQQLEE